MRKEDTVRKKCDCCMKTFVGNECKGQWWYFNSYDTGIRTIRGFYCPKCSDGIYKERRENERRNNSSM